MDRMKRFASGLAFRLGYSIVPNWRLEKYPQTEFLRRFLRLLEIDCVLDVGANRGQFHDFLRNDVGFDGLIVSFEPLPSLADLLASRRQSDPAWVIQTYALGETNGNAPFNVMASNTFSSLLEPRHDATSMFTESNEVIEKIDVKIRRLDAAVDDLRRQHAIERPYLKLDTQGYDVSVLRGAGKFLEQVRGLQTEASVTPIYVGAPGFAEAIAFLQECGFELAGIFPNNPMHFPRMIEFDCHMIRRSLIPAHLR